MDPKASRPEFRIECLQRGFDLVEVGAECGGDLVRGDTTLAFVEQPSDGGDEILRRRWPDETFQRVDEVERQVAVVDKPKHVPVASGDLLRPGEVVSLVAERLPFRFTADTHTRAWKYFKVRPPSGAAEPEATDQRYCRWDRLMRGHGYTQAWVEMLVEQLSIEEQYEVVVGVRPDRR